MRAGGIGAGASKHFRIVPPWDARTQAPFAGLVQKYSVQNWNTRARTCACGCGSSVSAKANFRPGHNSRKHEPIGDTPHDLVVKGKSVLIDEQDWPLIVGGNLVLLRARSKRENWYVHLYKDGRSRALHRVVVDAPDGVLVDHINGSGLDNRRANLRLCDAAQNNANRKSEPTGRAGLWGVSRHWWATAHPEWGAPYTCAISHRGRLYRLGGYYTAEEAAVAYDAASIILNGEFATLNFPDQPIPAETNDKVIALLKAKGGIGD